MSSKPNDGGPAFPGIERINLIRGGYDEVPMQGMTLRDYFAAKAMQAILTALANCAASPGSKESSSDGISRTAYDAADAMIRARDDSHA